jgi:hypothetical protein
LSRTFILIVAAHTLNQLGRALGVTPESLCQTAEPERDVVKLRIESAARNALTLVALRYRISRENIVEVAPLLFFIAAEQCLQERQSRVDEVRDAAGSLDDLQRKIRHLPLPIWPVDEQAISREEQSIKARDLFGTKVDQYADQFENGYDDEYDKAKDNPFAVFLQNALAKVSNSHKGPKPVRWLPFLCPSYEICAEEAAAIVGGDTKAAQAILCGEAALHEMPKGSPAERAKWARAEWERKFKDSGLYDLFVRDGLIEPSAADDDNGNPTESNKGVAP